jgi:ABC-type multidrug transport system fused ATPase/permease subunit
MNRVHDGQAALNGQARAVSARPPIARPTWSNLTLLRQLIYLLIPHFGLFIRLVSIAMLLVLSEAVGLGVVLLFLGAAGSGGTLDWSWLPLPIAHIMTGLSLASRVRLAALALILITISRGVLRYFQHTLGSRLRIAVVGDLQDQVFKQMHAVQLDYLQRERAGVLSSLVGHFPTQIGRLISDPVRPSPI